MPALDFSSDIASFCPSAHINFDAAGARCWNLCLTVNLETLKILVQLTRESN